MNALLNLTFPHCTTSDFRCASVAFNNQNVERLQAELINFTVLQFEFLQIS